MLRISKKLRSRKRSGQASMRQACPTRPALHVHQPAVRPLKLMVKKKIKGWERRAVSRQLKKEARRLSSARSKLGLEHKAVANNINCDEHVCIFNSFFNCFTSLSSHCIVTWSTHLILSGSLIRGKIKRDPRLIAWGPLARLAL